MANSGSATAATTSDPQDRWNLIYVIFYWLGMGSLLPWNFFIAGLYVVVRTVDIL